MTKQKSANPVQTPDALSGKMDDFYKAINHVNHLACVLVTTSYLEQCLATLLRQFFIAGASTAETIFDYTKNGLLTEISARSKMAYCLGLIDKQAFTNLNTIGNIRNRFAHTHPELTFDDAQIKGFCKDLKLPPISGGVKVDESGSSPLTQKEFETPYEDDPKRKYMLIAAITANKILVKAMTTMRCNQKVPATLNQALIDPPELTKSPPDPSEPQ